MPLLTLPTEVLLEVVALSAETGGLQVKGIAATCRQLRVLCLEYLYERPETYHYRGIETLLEILASDSKIASYVRGITLWFPDAPMEGLQSQFIPSYRKILQLCPGVQRLRIPSSMDPHAESFYSIMSDFLDQAGASSRTNINLIDLEVFPRMMLWKHLKRLSNFSHLTTLYLTRFFRQSGVQTRGPTSVLEGSGIGASGSGVGSRVQVRDDQATLGCA